MNAVGALLRGGLVPALCALLPAACDASPRGEGPPEVQPGVQARPAAEACETEPPPPYAPSAVQRERDEIFSLLAYAVVLTDYQGAQRRRGLDIAAVLVDAEAQPVCWARNAIAAADNVTEHAELRMLRNYLDNVPGRKLPRGMTVYTTLEPCAMCAGALLMGRAARVIYGATAGRSGGVYERLYADSRSGGGRCPYPYRITWAGAPTPLRAQLEQVHRTGNAQTVHDARRTVHEQAQQALATFVPNHEANRAVLERARRFLRGIPRQPVGRAYDLLCPPGPPAAPAGESPGAPGAPRGRP